MEFGGGKLGAVNGMTKSGQLEIVSMQSEEIWTGVTYGLSSTLLMEVSDTATAPSNIRSFFLHIEFSKGGVSHLRRHLQHLL